MVSSMTNVSSSDSSTSLVKPLRLDSVTRHSSHLISTSLSLKPDDIPQYKHLKLIKRGHYGHAESSKICGASFESVPAWIWSLRLSDWEAIVIPAADEVRLRQFYHPTWLLLRDKLKIVASVRDPGLDDSVNVWFVSGSKGFLEAFDGFPETPTILWAERCGRRRPADINDWTWFTVSHESVGGSTTARGVFGKRHVDNLNVEVDPLKRTINHIMKFSIRPTPCVFPCPNPHYLLIHRLSLTKLKQPVVYESCFSRTGWGKRELTEAELSQAFDLPPYLPWDPGFAISLIPIQLFRAVIEAFLVTLESPEQRRSKPRARLDVTPISPLTVDATWLEGIGVWLPGTWSHSAISGKAVKSDDAEIEQYPWNQRILLVLPAGSLTAIRSFEAFSLKVWFRRLVCSFVEYLSTEYGPRWRYDVARYDRVRRSEGGSSGASLRGKKRKRLGEVPEPHKVGGTRSSLALLSLSQDVKCGFRIIRQVSASSWWEWTGGSSLFFWRWNGRDQIRMARDGIPISVSAPLPKQRRQKASRFDPVQKAMVAGKIAAMMKRDYLETGHVSNTVHFFAVPKGDSDIRVVFDGTSSGLNETLWAPNFFLPSAKSASMCLSFDTWMADMDFGDFFHNFFMDSRIRPFSGVNLGSIGPLVPGLDQADKVGVSSRPTVLRWTRLFMGMRPSPYLAIRQYYWGEEFARGNPVRVGNPMGYDRVRLNLPGMESYNPVLPKVMKWREDRKHVGGGHVAGDVVTFVDDVRVTGYSKSNCWDVYHQFASRVQYLGMQNAPRKFRPPSQADAGAWTGTIFKIGSDHITKSVSQEKWEKGREMIERHHLEIGRSSDSRPFLDRRRLEKETGFLNHLSMTYETMIPFLKGFYLTLNSWREGRDENDWKLSAKRWKVILFAKAANGSVTDKEVDVELDRDDAAVGAPKLVRASPSLKRDVEALWFMMSNTCTPKVSIRSKSVLTIVYGFGDASGSGLGATFTCGGGFNFRIGVWGSDEGPESSNWKEFSNIVESLEDEAESGNLSSSEVYMFTDNSTVESCAAKGSSSSPKLLELVIRLQGLMTRSGVKIHISHVAGTRMIAQGTDGVSRGYLGQGVMAGDAMVAHIPVHLDASKRSPNLVPWIRSWSDEEATHLEPEGWFESGHDIEGWQMGSDGFERPKLSEVRRTYIWTPAPMAAEVAVAEMRKARIKRQRACHIFVCPRLCTTQWVKQLFRSSDFVFELPVGFLCWPADMHEPLLIGVLFPFLSVIPWQIKGSPKMYAVGRELRKMFEESEVGTRSVLRKLWTLGCDLSSMPEHMVRQLLFLR